MIRMYEVKLKIGKDTYMFVLLARNKLDAEKKAFKSLKKQIEVVSVRCGRRIY